MPRALIHDLREGMPFALIGDRNRDGAVFSQSGMWDREILCEVHERQLGESDDYAVEFCRTFSALATKLDDAPGYMVPNPRPELLTRFVMSVVWRFAVSRHGKSHQARLGPYEARLRDLIFGLGTGLKEPEIMVVRHEYKLDSYDVKLATHPSAARFKGLLYWHFNVSSLDFRMKLDARADEFPPILLANGSNPLVVFDQGIDEVRDTPAILHILSKISKGRSWWFTSRLT